MLLKIKGSSLYSTGQLNRENIKEKKLHMHKARVGKTGKNPLVFLKMSPWLFQRFFLQIMGPVLLHVQP